MTSVISLAFAVNSAAALLIGAYVYVSASNKTQNGVFLVYNILFATWGLSLYKAIESGSDALSMYWFRASLGALIFLVPVFLHFLSLYSDRKVFKKSILGRVYILFSLFFVSSFFLSNEFIKGVAPSLYFKRLIVPGPAFTVFVFVFTGFVFCGFYYLARSAKLYLRVKRNQRMWLFLGMLFGTFAPFSFILAAYKISYFPFGVFCVIPYLAVTGYAVMQYHVPEMDTVVGKTVVLSYFTLFVILAHILIVHILNRIVGMEYFVSSVISGGTLLLCLLFAAHYSGMLKLTRITDRIVYGRKLDYYRFLENFSSVTERATDLNDLAHYALDALTNTMNVKNATLYLYNENSREFELVAYKGLDRDKLGSINKVPLLDPLVGFLGEGNVYVTSEGEDFAAEYDLEKIKNAFEKVNKKTAMQIRYSLPLYYKQDLIGFLNMGDKDDGRPYRREDMDILNAFGRGLAVSIDNVKLYSRAIEDDLTKLYRVNYFNRRLEEERERSIRYLRPFSMLFIDVDDFKKINDTFGHRTGDKVLQKIAYIIKCGIRNSDIAGRYGGEEFSVLMPETGREKAYLAAERLRKSVEEGFQKGDKPIKVTISIGVAEYKSGMKKYELIEHADRALYRAKYEGKNRVS